jgi:hypothetical protein
MPPTDDRTPLPRYRGKRWIRKGLPTRAESWLDSPRQSLREDRGRRHRVDHALRKAVRRGRWEWPKRPVFFLADPHADAEAFNASLVASGGARKTGPGPGDIRLTEAGRRARFVIGGDCLDKGPSNLGLLRAIHLLMDSGARVKLLAGNHDIRLLMGIRSTMLKRDPRTEHLFVRMGPKVVPLLKEVHDSYLPHKKALRDVPDRKTCRRRLYPSPQWFDRFPEVAGWLMPEQAIERELIRMRKKVDRFEGACEDAGLSMRQVYATAMRCRELFFDERGEFGWFFRRMQLCHRDGAFLFIHAGVDDRIASLIEDRGTAHLNALYRDLVWRDPFEFYYGPLANAMRTKYRQVDMPLTRHGVDSLNRRGIRAVVHGHRNRTDGQRIMLRRGMIHVEGDTTMDRNSRAKEGLRGYGIGVTIVDPEGRIVGISNDYPYAKVLEPERLAKKSGRR